MARATAAVTASDAVAVALVEVVAGDGHRVGDVGDADDVAAPGGGVGIQGGGLHLDADRPGVDGCSDRCLGLAVGRVGGPRRPAQQHGRPVERGAGRGAQRLQGGGEVAGEVGPGVRGLVVQARSFVAYRAVDEDEVRRVGQWCELSGGGDADDEGRSAGGELFGDQDCEWGSDPAAHDPHGQPVDVGGPRLGVVAGPARVAVSAAGLCEVADDVAVGVQEADGRDRAIGQVLLPAGLAEQVLRQEHRRRGVVLAPKQGHAAGSCAVHGQGSCQPGGAVCGSGLH